VLLALIDLCLAGTQASSAPPEMVTTRQLADTIVEIYWPHTVPFASRAEARILSKNTRGQAEIVSAVLTFRSRHAPDASVGRWHARVAAPAAYERLVKTVEWKLIEMPLPRLQMMGQSLDPFIYEIHWDARVQRRDIERDGFDNRVLLRPRVGEYFLQLNGLLRPLIQRRWAVGGNGRAAQPAGGLSAASGRCAAVAAAPGVRGPRRGEIGGGAHADPIPGPP